MDQHFIQTPTPELLIERLVSSINTALLADTPVAWLLSGGSAIAIAVAAASRLVADEHRRQLRILQVDERYGPVRHPDSNWHQLLDAGFDCTGAVYQPTLRNLPFDKTVESYEADLTDALDNCKLRIGLLGIGPDGHTAGMLPGSIAAREKTRLAIGYPGPDYMRITMTTPAIARLDIATAFVGGTAKRPVIERLRNDAPISEQPGQAIKMAAGWYIYSDVLE